MTHKRRYIDEYAFAEEPFLEWLEGLGRQALRLKLSFGKVSYASMGDIGRKKSVSVDLRSYAAYEHTPLHRHQRDDNRVNCGGSWNNDAQNCRVANRNNNTPSNRNNNIGFRFVSSF